MGFIPYPYPNPYSKFEKPEYRMSTTPWVVFYDFKVVKRFPWDIMLGRRRWVHFLPGSIFFGLYISLSLTWSQLKPIIFSALWRGAFDGNVLMAERKPHYFPEEELFNYRVESPLWSMYVPKSPFDSSTYTGGDGTAELSYILPTHFTGWLEWFQYSHLLWMIPCVCLGGGLFWLYHFCNHRSVSFNAATAKRFWAFKKRKTVGAPTEDDWVYVLWVKFVLSIYFALFFCGLWYLTIFQVNFLGLVEWLGPIHYKSALVYFHCYGNGAEYPLPLGDGMASFEGMLRWWKADLARGGFYTKCFIGTTLDNLMPMLQPYTMEFMEGCDLPYMAPGEDFYNYLYKCSPELWTMVRVAHRQSMGDWMKSPAPPLWSFGAVTLGILVLVAYFRILFM